MTRNGMKRGEDNKRETEDSQQYHLYINLYMHALILLVYKSPTLIIINS